MRVHRLHQLNPVPVTQGEPESRTVSICLRVIMGNGPEENMSSDHTYFPQVMATQGPADGGIFNLQPSGCPVLLTQPDTQCLRGTADLRSDGADSGPL